MNHLNLKKQANALRLLSARMTQTANSGHPGMPLGMADVCTVLWNDFINWSNKNPKWDNRDRFILSCGHGSALLYSILYCMGVAELEDLRQFRQLGSRTPGHPELDCLPGVEITTGPLGQGLAWGIGMAKAAHDLNRNHYTYIVCSDGDLMEGIAHEALALASLWNLNNLIVLWDDNKITIDGGTSLSSKNPLENIFHAHGWEVIDCDGHDFEDIHKSIKKAQSLEKSVCIKCQTIIGFGLDTAGTAKAHGSPVKDLGQLKLNLGIEYDEVPEDILDLWQKPILRGNALMEADKSKYDLAVEPGIFEKIYHKIKDKIPTKTSTRKINQYIIRELDERFVIGSADLGESTCVDGANYLHFGVREHAMVATMGGMALYGRPVVLATFLTFLDYARPAIRLSALMKIPMTIIATHDSIGLGEDGPTHQPIEQLNSYRIMPNLDLWRPCNVEEMIAAWESSFTHKGPTIIACSRQDFEMHSSELALCRRGGYLIKEVEDSSVKLISTGSEVALAMKTNASVISMPCVEVFERQDKSYKDQLLAGEVISIEAGSTGFWYKYADQCIGIDEFGESGKAEELYAHFGLDVGCIMYDFLS